MRNLNNRFCQQQRRKTLIASMDSSSSSSSQQNPYPPYPAPLPPQQQQQPPYNPTRYQPYYSIYQPPPTYHHHQQPQQQQQYSSYYPPNYSNVSYPPPQQQHPQTHHQEPPIHPPGVSIQPSHGQPHFQLPNTQNTYHFPQRTDGVGAVAALSQLAASVGAPPERPRWYPQPQGFGPVIGGPGMYTGTGLGSAAFPGHGPGPGPGPSGLRPHAGQSLDKGGGRKRDGGRRSGDRQSKGGGTRSGDGQRKDGGRRRGDGQSKDGGRRRGDGQSKDGGRRRGDGQSKGGGRRRGDGQSKGGGRRRDYGQNKDVGRGKFMCEMCNVDCGCMGILRMHLNGKRHKKNLEKLEANENRTVSDSENVQKPSGDLKPGTTMKPDNLLVEEETKQNPPQDIPLEEESKQNPPQDIPLEEETKQSPPQDIIPLEEETKQSPPQDIPLEEETKQCPPQDIPLEEETKQSPPQDMPLEEETKQSPPQDVPLEEETKQSPPQDIPLDTVSSENKLETEQKIDNAQQANPPKDANGDLLEKKPMMNQSGNQKSGVKRKALVGERKKKKVSKAKRLAFEPSKSIVVVPLMCDLCNVKCGTREILRQHLLGCQHMSTLKRFEGHHPIYGQVGLQAIYPPNSVTNSLYHSQGAQQVSNGAQVSDPIAGASLLPQNENAAPSATGVGLN